MSGASPVFSLAGTAANNIAVNIGAMIVVVGSVLWGTHYLSARHDSETVQLQARQQAELIAQQLSLFGQSLQDRSIRLEAESALAEGSPAVISEWTRQQLKYLPQAVAVALVANADSSYATPVPEDCNPADVVRLPVSSDVPVRWLSNGSERFSGLVPVVSRKDNKIIGVVCATFSVDALQGRITRVLAAGQRVTIQDGSGRELATAGEIPRGAELLVATADLDIGDWRLQLEQAAPDHATEYLVLGGAIALIVLLPVVLAVRNARRLRVAADELHGFVDYLRLAGQDGFSPEPPTCKVWETAGLLPVVQRTYADLHRSREALEELSFTDGLTKLPNRSYFMKMWGHAFELAKRGNDICVLSIEVSDFKQANDRLGSEAADELLKMVAETLKHQTRKSDFAGRLGLYNFAAIFYNAKGHLMRNRLAQLQQDFVRRQKQSAATARTVYCKLTCGLTYVDPHRDERPEDTLLRADDALRAAKRVGGNHMELFLPNPPEQTDQQEVTMATANALGARENSG